MKLLNRIIGFTKKISTGEHPIKIKYNTDEWERQFVKGNWDFLLRKHENIVLVADMLKQLAEEKGKKLQVLDIGCGNGALALALDQESFAYHGTDISQVAIDTAAKRVPWGVFQQSNMDSEVPFPDQEFDVVVFCEVLVYVDYEDVLRRYAPRLVQDGVFLISLYDVWRTKIIWRHIIRSLTVMKHVFVKNKTRNVGWNIVIGRLK